MFSNDFKDQKSIPKEKPKENPKKPEKDEFSINDDDLRYTFG
jgi:hypothetical protein